MRTIGEFKLEFITKLENLQNAKDEFISFLLSDLDTSHYSDDIKDQMVEMIKSCNLIEDYENFPYDLIDYISDEIEMRL